MQETAPIPLWADLLAVAAGASQGTSLALAEERHRLAPTGAVVLAIATGLGGGIARDVLLNLRPAFLESNGYLGAAIAAACATWALGHWFDLRRWVWPLDDASLGLYACAGALKAQHAGLGVLDVICVGVVASTGGGVLRDLLLARVPRLMAPGQLYMVPAIASAGALVALTRLGAPLEVRFFGAAALGFGLRVLAVWRGWEMGPVRYVGRRARP